MTQSAKLAIGGAAAEQKTRAARPQTGDQLELTIESLAFGGSGVARLDGYVVFVRGGLPGDRVRAQIGKSKRSFAEARVVELLEAGASRIPERAPHPGASWQALAYDEQLQVKQTQVEDALRRLGGLEIAVDPIVPAPAEGRWRYRNKLEYSFGQSEDGTLALGFHVPGRWDLVEDVDDVVLASEQANEIRRRVRDWCRAQGLVAFDSGTRAGFLRNLFVRESKHTGQTMVRLVTSQGELDAHALTEELQDFATSIIWTRTKPTTESLEGAENFQLFGPPFYEEELGGLRFRVSPDAFFQTNTEQAERLYEVAKEFAEVSTTDRVLDLYCGIGTISLTLAKRAAHVIGLEIVPAAIKDAKVNARLNEIENASFVAGDTRVALRELLAQSGKPDICIIDPPRAGLSQKVVRRVLETAAKRIVYVSCNPTTLAPNLRQMQDGGYKVERVRPVDMFPQTPHIECVACLTR